MTSVRVQYDAYNRIFKILDSPTPRTLEDGQTYLVLDFSTKDFGIDEMTEEVETNLQHA